MKCAPSHTDFLVIAAGVTGLRAAIELASAGGVVVLDKGEISEAAPHPAQGGIDALSDEDEASLHLEDTVNAGACLSNRDTVKNASMLLKFRTRATSPLPTAASMRKN
jgi:L-aspartate oxidase